MRIFEQTPFDERIAAQSTYEALKLGAALHPDAPAIQFLRQCDPDEEPLTISHAQFMARVTQSANLFTSLGIGPQDVVSLLLPLLPESFYTLFGAEAVGIANPVNPLLEPVQIAEILRAARTKVLVTLGPTEGADIWEKVQRLRREFAHDLPHLESIVVVHGKGDPAARCIAYAEEIDKQPSNRLVSGRAIASGETAAYFHTGGTTGTPKLVRHSHGNQVYQAWVCGLMLRISAGRSNLFGMPLFHVGGALTQSLSALCGGNSLVVLSPSGWRNPKAALNVWRLVQRYRPATLGSVPTVLAAALNIPVGDADVSSIERVSGGGSAIPLAVCKAYTERFKVPVLEVYGMTETSSVHTIGYMDRPVRLGSVGHAVPYSQVRIVKVDADGRWLGDCKPNEIGVVAMAGPGVFSGYMSEQHNHGAFVEPGWVNSGDLGRLDEEGYLWITGRAKDLIIRGGHNIDPLAIEEVFFQHPAVALPAVVGQPDVYAGELPVAFVQLKPDAPADREALRKEMLAFVRERTPERAAVPVNLYFIDAIPLTGVGKVFKPALRLDAAERMVRQLLADLAAPGMSLQVQVGAHAVHGNLISVRLSGLVEAGRAGMESEIHKRLDPLTLRHEILWSEV